MDIIVFLDNRLGASVYTFRYKQAGTVEVTPFLKLLSEDWSNYRAALHENLYL